MFILVLSLISVFIVLKNYVPDTYLSGWDTLHPEFNFTLNFERLISGVFREEQGLGAVAAHAHMSDLPRVILLYLSSFILPKEILRYLFIAINLILGPLGVYFFVKNIILNDLEKKFKESFAFLGSLFYLLNFGTVQHFYVPFEMFAFQYGFLPWLFLTASNFLKKSSKKNLLIYSIVTLISTPMAYASMLWYAFFLCFLSFLIFFFKSYKKNVLKLIVITLLINSFWLLPNIYFVLSGNASIVPEAKINKIFSEEAFFYNKSYGNILDTVIFKNFLIDWAVFKGNDQFGFLMEGWREHLSKPWILGIGYLNALIVILGVLFVIKFNKFAKALIVPLLVSIFFLINLNPPFESLFSFIRDNSTLLKEALRFPFTKFSIILMFTFSVFFSIGCLCLLRIINRFKIISSRLLNIQIVFMSLLLVMYMFPVFKGDLISKYMQIRIPDEYFQMFDFFNNEPRDKRVAFLPIPSFWGWIYYDFGFQGAQFLSFGIKQPIMDRDYDRWNPNNEQYFKEFSYAIYSQNNELLNNILEKYQIGYLVVDKNILVPNQSSNPETLFLSEINLTLGNNKKLSLIKSFNEIEIYKVNLQTETQNDIESKTQILEKVSNDNAQDIDWVYSKYGDYITGGNLAGFIDTPFSSLTDNQNIINKDIVDIKNEEIQISSKNLPGKTTFSLEDYPIQEKTMPTDLYIKKENSGYKIKLVFKAIQLGSNIDLPFLEFVIPLSTEPEILNIDQFQNIFLNNITSDYSYQGSFIMSSSNNNFGFYTENINKPFTNVELENIDSDSQLCSPKSIDQIIGADKNGSDLKLFAKNAKNCIKIPLNKLVNINERTSFKNLLLLNFQVVSNSAYGHYCIYDQILKRCIKEQADIKSDDNFNDFILVDWDNVENLQIHFYLNSASQKLDDITYKNIRYKILEPKEILSVFLTEIVSSFNNKKITIDSNSKLSLSFPAIDLSDMLKSKRKSTTCGNLQPVFFNRRRAEKKAYVEYSSIKGSSCDFLNLPNILHNIGYVVSITSQNISGLPLRFCVTNPYSKRCDLNIALPQNKDLKRDLLLLPALNDGGAGYEIHFDNYSVGNIKTTNRISELKIYPFPYTWFTSLILNERGEDNLSNTKITNVKTLTPDIKLISVENNNPVTGLIALNQSYDKGFFAPGFKHVKVNGWANGWLIDAGFNGKIWIIYLPQFLEFFGFSLVIITFLVLLFNFSKFITRESLGS